MQHAYAETHHFFARGAGIDRYFVAPGKGHQIGFIRETRTIQEIRPQLLALHEAWISWRRGRRLSNCRSSSLRLSCRQHAKLREKRKEAQVRKLAQGFADVLQFLC